MQAHTAYAALAPAQAPRRTDHSAMPALYRAAIGPINTDRYLQFFERQDDTGRTLTGWNWAAALCTLNWMVFRQLWGAALVYVAALEGVALVVFAIGHQVLGLPMSVLAGLGLAWLAAACVLPGLYGDAIVHAELRKKIDKALAAAATMPQARERLQAQAASRRRLVWIAAANAALALLAGALWLAFPDGGRDALSRAQAPQRPAPSLSPALPSSHAPGLGTTAAPEDTGRARASSAPAAETLPAQAEATAATASAALPEAPAPVSALSSAMPSASSPARTSAPSSPPSSAPVSAPVPAAVPASTAASRANAVATSAQRASAPSSAPAAAQPAPRAALPAVAAQRGPARDPASARAPAGSSAPLPASAPGERKLYINVGLFGDPANARRAHARLREADLPADQGTVTMSSGRKLTRVRVGPFTSTADANAAAAKIREMGLDTAAAQQ